MRATRRVTSHDGTRLAIHESGPASGAVVVAVHGYPDNSSVWDGVARALGAGYRVVAYDVRGAGDSDKPKEPAAYRMSSLVDDLVAVLDVIRSERPVHLLGHDWGAVQLWPALTDPRLDGRIAGFTSISGPSLEHAAAWLKQVHVHPLATLHQLAESSYTALFRLPRLPEAAIGAGLFDRLLGDRPRADQLNGLNLYRANVRAVRKSTPATINVPVQVIAPRDDRFITPRLAIEAPRPFAVDLRTHVVAGGHWVIRDRPDVIAHLVRAHATAHPGQAPTAPSSATSSSSR